MLKALARKTPPLISARLFSTSQCRQKTGIVLMNMGGPSKSEDTYDFLLRLFRDKDLIPLGPFQNMVGKLIALRRYKTIAKHYDEIGGGSPILKYSEFQAKKTCELLDKIHPSTAPHFPYIAFRYAHPLTEHAYEQMLKDGIDRAVAFTQYPQYSFSTTQSNLNELKRVRDAMDPDHKIEWSSILQWPTHPGFIDTVAKHVKDALAKFPEQDRKDVVVLFSAHSLPMVVVNQGDPYVAEVSATVYAVMQKLGFCNSYRLTWQSEVGPQAWLGAQTIDAIKSLEKLDNYKGVVVVPIAFTTDHIETLHEIDIEMKEELSKPDLMVRSESLNEDPKFVEAMADMIVQHLDKDSAAEIESGIAIHANFPKFSK